MIKKIFIISVLIMSLGSMANAMTKSEAFEICRDNCGYANLFTAPAENNEYSQYLMSYNNFLNYLDEQTNQYLYVVREQVRNEFNIYFYDEFNITGNNYVAKVNNGRYQTVKNAYSFNNYYNTQDSFSQAGSTTTNKSFPTASGTFYMLFDGTNIIASSFVPPATFEYTPNYFQKVFYTGIADEYNSLKYDYSISSWKLGTFDKIPENANKIIVELHFSDGGIALTDSFLTFTKNFNDRYYFINNDNLYVYSRYIKYNTKYNLLFYLYDANNNFIDSYQYNYVFLPTNATIENGVVVNPGSGDYSVQDSTNDTIGVITDDSDVDPIINETFSGDVENFASDFGFTPLDNPFSTFLLHIVDSLYDALTIRQDVVLSADYFNMHFSFNSADFVANYELKNLVSACMVFLYLYYNYIFFNHLLTLIEIGNVEDVIDLLGYDEFYDSNMM